MLKLIKSVKNLFNIDVRFMSANAFR